MYQINFQTVTTVTFDLEGDVEIETVNTFLERILWEKTVCDSEGHHMDIFRLKVGHVNLYMSRGQGPGGGGSQ